MLTEVLLNYDIARVVDNSLAMYNCNCELTEMSRTVLNISFAWYLSITIVCNTLYN